MNITYICSDQDLSTSYDATDPDSNITLLSTPYITGLGGELFLNQSSACVAAESDALRTMTTKIDGTTEDQTTAEMGILYLA